MGRKKKKKVEVVKSDSGTGTGTGTGSPVPVQVKSATVDAKTVSGKFTIDIALESNGRKVHVIVHKVVDKKREEKRRDVIARAKRVMNKYRMKIHIPQRRSVALPGQYDREFIQELKTSGNYLVTEPGAKKDTSGVDKIDALVNMLEHETVGSNVSSLIGELCQNYAGTLM